MKKILPILLLFIAGLAAATETPSTGGVTTDYQAWAGRKVLQADALLARGALSGAVTIDKNESTYQTADPNGSDRNMTLPAVELTGMRFEIANVGSANSLIIKNPAGSTIISISAGQVGVVSCTGTAWTGFTYSGASTTGFLTTDGTTTGASSQTQTFTNGVTLNAIAGQTAATTFTFTGKVGASAAGQTATFTAGAGNGAFAGGDITVAGGGSGTGATGNGGIGKVVGGAALSTAGTGGKFQGIGGLGTTTGAGGAAELTGGVGGSSGAGGAATVTGGASAGAGGTAGAVAIDAGAATGGTPAGITIGTTNATFVKVGSLVGVPATVQDIATGNTITLPSNTFVKRLTASGGAATSVVLTAGAYDGQILVLLNADTTNNITFDATAGTGHVAEGAAVITAKCAITVVYDSTTSLWYKVR